MKVYNRFTLFFSALIISVIILPSCGTSITSVYDYYIQNNVAQHKAGTMSSNKTRLLYRHQEFTNKAQLEFIAFKNDTQKFLVIGSHKIVKSFYIYDSLYYFDVKDLYSNVRGNDFIRQLGDLSIFFTHISLDKCNAFLINLDKLKSEYQRSSPVEGSESHFDFALSNDVFVSLEKTRPTQVIDEAKTTLWVGRRKHNIKLEDLVKAIQDLKNFN